MGTLLYIIAVILVIGWAVGFFAFHAGGLKNVLVTNGYINRKPLEDLLPVVDAMNIDVKAFNEGFYAKQCGGRLQPVLDNVRFLYGKVHIELTMLVIPGLNDSAQEIDRFTDWVASMDRAIPVHFSAYHPAYRLTVPATSQGTIGEIWKRAKTRLDHVYAGNVRIPGTEDTRCAGCGHLLIGRSWMKAEIRGLKDGRCAKCGREPRNLVLE